MLQTHLEDKDKQMEIGTIISYLTVLELSIVIFLDVINKFSGC